VAKLLPVEMLKCKQLYADMHCHGGTPNALCSEWSYEVFFSVLQYSSDITVVPCCINSTISTPFLSQETVAISFVAGNVCLNFFGLFDECV
jgi:hypothetical protein